MGRTGHYRATRYRGIRQYIRADGTPGPYAVEVYHQGQRAAGREDTLQEARDRQQELLAKLKTGTYDPSAGRRSVGDAIDKYLRSDLFLQLSAKEQKGRRHSLDWWKSRHEGRPLSQLTGPLLADERDYLAEAEGLAPATVNRRLTHLSVALRPSIEAGWLHGNPVRLILRPRERPELGEILTDDEVLRLLAACELSKDHRLRHLVPCILSCGARISEYMGTRIVEVDTARGTSLVRGKTGPRIVHYHGRGLEALRAAMEVPSITGYLWASRRRGGIHPPRKPMCAALKVAEITKPGAWHMLRRTCGTWLAALGASDSEIREHLGHAPGSPATARYVLLGQVVRTELAGEFVRRRRMVA